MSSLFLHCNVNFLVRSRCFGFYSLPGPFFGYCLGGLSHLRHRPDHLDSTIASSSAWYTIRKRHYRSDQAQYRCNPSSGARCAVERSPGLVRRIALCICSINGCCVCGYRCYSLRLCERSPEDSQIIRMRKRVECLRLLLGDWESPCDRLCHLYHKDQVAALISEWISISAAIILAAWGCSIKQWHDYIGYERRVPVIVLG